MAALLLHHTMISRFSARNARSIHVHAPVSRSTLPRPASCASTQSRRAAPVEELRTVQPSLDHRPASPVAHVAVGLHRRWAAPGPEAVETTGVGTRSEHICAVWGQDTNKRRVLLLLTELVQRLFDQTGDGCSSDTVVQLFLMVWGFNCNCIVVTLKTWVELYIRVSCYGVITKVSAG